MDPVQRVMFKAMISVERAEAKIEVIEGVIADFFRLHLGGETATIDELMDGIRATGEKLLTMQSQAMQAKDAAFVAMQDLKAGIAEQMQKQKQAASDPPPIAAVPGD